MKEAAKISSKKRREEEGGQRASDSQAAELSPHLYGIRMADLPMDYLQAKSIAGGPQDRYEQEAERVAQQVGRSFNAVNKKIEVKQGNTPGALVRKGAQPGPSYLVRKSDGKDGEVKTQQVELSKPKTEAEKELFRLHEAGRRALETLREKHAANDSYKKSAHVRPSVVQKGGTASAKEGTALPRWLWDLQTYLMEGTQWTQDEENAQMAIRDYLKHWTAISYGGKLVGSLVYFFDFVGRSQQNVAAQRKLGPNIKTTAEMGGYGPKAKNWCTWAATRALKQGLKLPGLSSATGEQVSGQPPSSSGKKVIWGEAAYSAELLPGDIVMYLFDGAQYGGHTATIVADMGDSFIDVSGNTGSGVGVGISQRQRLKEEPKSKSFASFNIHKTSAASDKTEERQRASRYVRSFDYQGAVLVYSIQRHDQLYLEVGEAETAISPEERKEKVEKGVKKSK